MIRKAEVFMISTSLVGVIDRIIGAGPEMALLLDIFYLILQPRQAILVEKKGCGTG